MDAIVAHFQEWIAAYAIGAVLLLPVLYFTRSYSVPAILFSIETVIYCFLMHTAMWCIVGLATWFKNNSSMKALDAEGKVVEVADWSIPYVEFWDRAQYNPEWVIYIEIVFAIVIFGMVIRYRPLKVHNPHKRRYDDSGKLITKSGKGGRGNYGRPPTRYTRGGH